MNEETIKKINQIFNRFTNDGTISHNVFIEKNKPMISNMKTNPLGMLERLNQNIMNIQSNILIIEINRVKITKKCKIWNGNYRSW